MGTGRHRQTGEHNGDGFEGSVGVGGGGGGWTIGVGVDIEARMGGGVKTGR